MVKKKKQCDVSAGNRKCRTAQNILIGPRRKAHPICMDSANTGAAISNVLSTEQQNLIASFGGFMEVRGIK